MDIIGMDLHKRESQRCVVDREGGITERRITTSRERLTAVLGGRPPARVLLEASTESEWVAVHLEALGHEVIVADPNFAPMYATRTRRVKTDRRDARTLADALRLGAYRPAHRVSADRRRIRAELAVRETLIRARTRFINVAKALVRREGLRVPSSASKRVVLRIRELARSQPLATELAPLLAVIEPLNVQIAAADDRLATLAHTDAAAARLATVPGVGPVTASALVAIADDITRFATAHQFEAYLGLVPGERSSGERRQVGHITKAGNRRARALLVEVAWSIMRSHRRETAALRAWATQIARRRGKRIAVVALARRLAGILYAMWRDEHAYDPARLRMPSPIADAP
jgi:transposase